MALLFASGTTPLAQGDESKSVTGLGLAFTPTNVTVSVVKPDAGSDLISAYLVGAPTADGFSAQLSAPVPSTGYVLSWQAFALEYAAAGAGTLAVGYESLFDSVARFLGYDPSNLSESQSAEVDGYVQSGVRQFYYPPAQGSRDEVHEWTFLHEDSAVTTIAEADAVAVPNIVGRVLGPGLWFDGYRMPPVLIVSEAQIASMRSARPCNGRPVYACLRRAARFGASGQANELVFWPTPNDAYTLRFRLECDPQPLSRTNPLPLGGPWYSELLMESCLSVAEQRANDEAGLHTERFTRLLESAISHDRRSGAEVFGPMSSPEGGHSRRAVQAPYTRFTITYNGVEI